MGTEMDELIGAALWMATVSVGRAALWLLSGGRWRGETLSGNEGRIHSAAGSLWFERDGRTVFTQTGQFFAGVAVWIIAVVGVFALALAA
jgi:hypothetical protein